MAMAAATITAVQPSLPPHHSSQNARRLLSSRTLRLKSRARVRALSTPPRAYLDPPSAAAAAAADGKEDEGSPSYSVVAAVKSLYNDIVVVDDASSRFLLLDSSHNIHSMLSKKQKWTGSYWDDFASLPAIIPHGPIGILGLGAGTAAHLMLESWPSLHIEGWEIDEILVDMAREYFGLSDLEKVTQAGGSLSVHIGDALSPSVAIEGGFAGIIVDLFSDGKILPQLKQGGGLQLSSSLGDRVECTANSDRDATWLEIEKKLMSNGRIMVNCGGAHAELSGSGDQAANANASPKGSWLQNSTIKALCQAFPGRLSWKKMAEDESDNYLALTGPVPDLDAWSASLPTPLSTNVKYWRPCELAS